MNSRILLILLACLAAEIAVVYLLIEVNVFIGLLLHFAVIGGVHILNKDKNRALQISLLSIALLGPLGAMGGLVLVLYKFFSPAKGKSFIEWFNSIFPKYKSSLAESVEEALENGRDLSAESYTVLPLKDIIVLGSEAQKQRALSNVSSNFYPSLLPALQLALKDKSSVIRMMASTIIAKVDHKIHYTIMGIERRLGFDSRPVLLKRLAEYHDLYAFSGLVDTRKAQYHRNEALKYYLKYLEKEPNNTKVRQNVARIYLRQGRDKEAYEWLKDCEDNNRFTLEMLTWQAEALFNLRDFKSLRILASTHKEKLERSDIHPPAFAEAITLWAGHAS